MANILGYGFAVVVGHCATWLVSARLWADLTPPLEERERLRPKPYHPAIVGVIERGLYVAAIQMTAVEFIGVWLAIKVAGQWNRWGEGLRDEDQVVVTGREFFNIFLIGNGLSIAFALVGAKLITWLTSGSNSLAIIVPAILVLATAAIYALIAWAAEGRPSGARNPQVQEP
ncbi:MAG: hypothetical protein V2A79_10880 [Planctomycetota bacterium]